MKAFNLVLYVILYLFSFQTLAQVKQSVLSGNYRDKPLREIVSEIETKGDVNFFFPEGLIDTFKITASFANEPIKDALDIILDEAPIRFYITDNNVSLVLDPDKELSIPRYTLTGVLKDNYGKVIHEPVVVSVSMLTIQQTSQGGTKPVWSYRKQVVTDERGEFAIDQLKAGKYRLKFDGENHYNTTEQVKVSDDASLDIKLVRKGAHSSETSPSGDEELGILQRVVTVKGTEVSIGELLDQLSRLGNFSFEYDPSVIPAEKKVTLQTNQTSVKKFLDEAFVGTSINYTEFSDKIILREINPNPKKYTISGNIIDAGTGESLIGVSVVVKGTNYGATSNQYGYYSLTIPEGDYVVVCSYIGYQPTVNEISLLSDVKINVELSDDLLQLQAVVITDEEILREVSDIKMGTTTLGIKTIKSMPPLLGEVDVIKSITLLPGVATVGEGTTGFNVRGGAIDQNLVILDEAPVYNTSHLFGFFSVFNPDIVKDVNFYKSGIPARYGGRLSSVLDVTQKEGNSQKFTTSGGVGLIGARLALEGPIVKDKSSFIIAGRKSYIGELLRGMEDFKDNFVGFYDLNSKLNFKINERNRVYWSAYSGKDNFTLGEDDIYLSYRNLTTTLRWNHLINDKLFSNFSAIYSNYKYVQGSTEKDYEFEGATGIVTYNLKSDFSYYLNSRHTIDYGLNCLLYQFKGLHVGPSSEISPIATIDVHDEYALEPAIYIQDEYNFSDKVKFSAGLRYSGFNIIGPGVVYVYQENQPREISNITDTLYYDNGEHIKWYGGLEPRLAVKVSLSKSSVLQLSYDRSRQNIHLISNTTSATPLDIWKGSDPYIKPEIGNQFSIGYFRNFKENAIETSVQVYYKGVQNIVDYKDGANLVLNKAITADLLAGVGKAYGMELSLNKVIGRFNGWMSYTYSRTLRQVNGEFLSEKINNGEYYPANYDFPNRVTFFATYKLSPLITLSSNFTYNTGRPTTYPDGRYTYGGLVIPQYSTRNQDRLTDYHRLDLALTIENKPHKKWHSQWVFSVYNVYSRRNAYSVYIKRMRHSQETESIRLSILGAALPSITYNFKF